MINLILKRTAVAARTVACAAFALCGTANAQVVINEFDYVQPGPDNAEFIELYATEQTSLTPFSIQLVGGATGSIYQTITLPPVVLAADDFFVICGSTSVTPNCDLEAPTAVDFIRNDVPGAIALISAGAIVDTVSYGGNSVAPYTELIGTPPDEDDEADLGLARVFDGFDTNFNDFDVRLFCITPGAPNEGIAQPCDGIYEIAEIQGASVMSPVAGQFVRTERNIVTGVRDESSMQGFYMQTPLNRQDNNPLTSEGIFVYTGSSPVVEVGDMVTVVGVVDDSERTHFTDSPFVQVISSNNPLPPATVFDGSTPSPLQPVGSMETLRFEGMLVDFSGVAASSSGTFLYTVPTMQRPFLEPGIVFPGEIGLPVWDGNEEILTVLLNGTDLASTRVFAGQIVSVLGHMGGRLSSSFRLWPVRINPGPEPQLPRAVRPSDNDELMIVTQHMRRLFDTVDNPDTPDGVVSEETLSRRLQKFSYHIRVTLAAPDIIAVQDVETLELLELLAAQMATDDPTLNYSAVHIASPLATNTGFLVRHDRVTVQSVETIGEDDAGLFSRPPLAIDAAFERDGATLDLTLINVQLPLGSNPLDPTFTNWFFPAERAVFLANYLEAERVSNPNKNIVLLGDFGAPQFSNGYADILGQITGVPDPLGSEIPYEPIVTVPLTNLTNSLPQPEQYGASFNGNLVAYDHMLVSENLVSRVNEYVFARGNTDAPLATASNIEEDIGLYVSNRDAAVLYLTTEFADFDGDGVANTNDNCTEAANPDQRDTNGDGFGNLCDADLNNDGVINVLDLGILRSAFFSTNADADFNGDGTVNVLDLGILRSTFFMAPGPSGLAGI
ncbi:MAG: thrombospondin type 3 repeat-containing protein [Gammaproteobacteria bacterium]